MNKKVMTDLLDRGADGNSILQILDALCNGMGDNSGGEASDDLTDSVLVENSMEQEELVEMEESVLVEA